MKKLFEETNAGVDYCFNDTSLNGSEEDFSLAFEEYKKSRECELINEKVYRCEVLNFVKAYTSKLKKPMLTINVRVNDGVETPKDIRVDYVFDNENKKYLETTFDKLKKALATLGYELNKFSNLSSLIEELKPFIGATVYIRPYDYEGNQKYDIVKKPM